MKYMKTFVQLINEDKITEQSGTDSLKTSFMNIFKMLKTKDDLSTMFNEQDELEIATDLYDAFIDAKEVMQLGENEIQEFADNLGVGDNPDIVTAIISKMYEDKFKRIIKDDIEFSIEALKDFIMVEESTERYKVLAKSYQTELEKIKDCF